MREIKFRAWNEKLKCMHVTDSVSLCIDGEICYLDTDGEWVADMANRITLMQYTGLKDKNGTEIYEGDIVKTKYNNAVLIKWIKTGFYPCRQGKTDQYNKVTNWNCVTRGEVIGNIYENPELLK